MHKNFHNSASSLERKVELKYDAIGRLAEESHRLATSGETRRFTFEYDGGRDRAIPGQLGRLTHVFGDGYAKSQRFNPDGTLKELSIQLAHWMEVSWSYTYYADGSTQKSMRTVRNLKDNILVESVQLEHRYDAFGRLEQLLLQENPLLTISYDAEGKPHVVTFADGATLSFAYDPTTHHLRGYHTNCAKWQAGVSWDFNARGQVAQEHFTFDRHQTERSYHYDDRGFLQQASAAATPAQYTYDGIGLLQTIEDSQGARTLTRQAKEGGGFTMQVGDARYAYDPLGRLISSGSLNLSYGPDGHLALAQRQDQSWQYLYDEAGNRILKLKGGVPVAGYLQGGYLTNKGFIDPVKVLGRLVGVLEKGQFHHLATDPRGSVLADRDGSERLLTPYGVRDRRPDLAMALDFVEKGYDADLGTIRMGLRDYDPLLGQFTTPDPLYLESLEHTLTSPLNSNLYGYAANDPLLFGDSEGQLPEVIDTYIEGNFAHVAANNLPRIHAASLPPHATPYPVNIPGGQPWPYYLGNKAHKEIFERVRELNREPGDRWFGNYSSINAILKRTTGSWVLDPGHAGRPDITIVRGQTTHVFEIKPFTLEGDARTQVEYYVGRLKAGGLSAIQGDPGLIGKGIVSGPGGVFAYWPSEPGVVLYAYFRASQEGELSPAKNKEALLQWRHFLAGLPHSPDLEEARVTSYIEGILKNAFEGASALRLGGLTFRPWPIPALR
jgi:RHS repeat-associated protein